MDRLERCKNHTHKILIIGFPESGKLSISRLLFGSTDCLGGPAFFKCALSPQTKLVKDLPEELLGQESRPDSNSALFLSSQSVMFVMNGGKNFVVEANAFCSLAHWYLSRMVAKHPIPKLHALVHKSDTIPPAKKECLLDELNRMCQDILGKVAYNSLNITFYLTNIYDNSLHLAFGCVLQGDLWLSACFVRLLRMFASVCAVDSAYLIDTRMRAIVAKDCRSPNVSEDCILSLVDLVSDCIAINGTEKSDGVLDGFGSVIFSESMHLSYQKLFHSLCIVAVAKIEVALERDLLLEQAKIFQECVCDFVSSCSFVVERATLL